MALEGSLRDFDLFSLFNMIKIQGKNGTLVLSQGQEFVKVFFENGEIVGCDSNQVRMEDRLGTMLVRLGRLTGDELLAMVQVQRQTLKRMGTLLLESGKVTATDIQDALFSQACCHGGSLGGLSQEGPARGSFSAHGGSFDLRPQTILHNVDRNALAPLPGWADRGLRAARDPGSAPAVQNEPEQAQPRREEAEPRTSGGHRQRWARQQIGIPRSG